MAMSYLPQRVSTCLIVSVFGVSSVGLSGCDNAADADRAEAQSIIEEANAELASIQLTGLSVDNEDDFAAAQQKLQKVSRSAGSLSSADDGQKAAGAMLAASAERRLAQLAMAQVAEIENQNADQRSQINALIDAVVELRHSNEHVQMYVEAARSAQIEQNRERIADQLSEVSAIMAELDAPIDELESTNREYAAAADQLRQEAAELRRRAAELGYAQGLEDFIDAADKQREADQLELKVARNEADLSYDLEARHNWAEAQATQYRNIVDRLSEARQQLEALEQTVGSEQSKTSQQLSQTQDALRSALQELTERIEGPATIAFDEALQHADAAASKAQTAASRIRGQEGSAARVLAARAEALRGQVEWARVRAYSDHIALLERLIATNAAPNASDLQAKLNAAAQTRDMATAAAKEAYANAQDKLSQVNARGDSADSVAAFTENVGAALRSLEGQSGASAMNMDSSDAASMTDARTGGESMNAAGGSPQNVLDRIAALDMSDMSNAMTILDLTYAETPDVQGILNANRQVFQSLIDFRAAASEAYGEEYAGQMSQRFAMGISQSVTMNDPTIVQEDGDSAVVSFTNAMGMQDTSELRNIDGEWMIVMSEDDLAESGMSADQVRGMLDYMKTNFNDLTSRIRNDGLTMQELQAEMMQFGQGMAQFQQP